MIWRKANDSNMTSRDVVDGGIRVQNWQGTRSCQGARSHWGTRNHQGSQGQEPRNLQGGGLEPLREFRITKGAGITEGLGAFRGPRTTKEFWTIRGPGTTKFRRWDPKTQGNQNLRKSRITGNYKQEIRR